MTIIVSQIYSWFKTIFTHLWLSISSINFYQRVITSYDGYGIKYILTLSFVSSLFCSIFILNYIDNIRQYFSYGTMSSSVVNLDHIISQLPELNYNGSEISLEDSEPLYINNTDNQPIAVIDAGNKLPPANKAKIPILLTSKKIIISFTGTEKTTNSSFPIEYWQLFGKKSTVLSQEVVRTALEKLFNAAPRVVIYLTFPIIALLIFFKIFLERSVFIIIVYLMTNFFMNIPTSIKTCIRLTMFTSGCFVLLQQTILLLVPVSEGFIWLLQIWANFLMILGILKSSNKTLFIRKK